MNNYETTDNIFWPYEPEEESTQDEYDEVDLNYAQQKLEKQ